MKFILPILILFLSFDGIGQSEHQLFTELLQKHVNSNGMVDYPGFLQDRDFLQNYLDQISNTDPSKFENENQKLAFWINAYNAFTIALIVDHYPVKSITDLHPVVYIPGIASVWNYHFFSIHNEPMSLHHIEHKILRKRFNEPRIHFAINCASMSCPVLRNEAYESDKLEAQLAHQTSLFINDPTRNKISNLELNLSKIFSWFQGDFTKEMSLVKFISIYSKIEISDNPQIKYLSYDWSLNEI